MIRMRIRAALLAAAGSLAGTNLAAAQEAVPVPPPAAPAVRVVAPPTCVPTPMPAVSATVFKLRNAAAADVAAALGTFFAQKPGVTVVAEPVSNTLLVSAPPEQFKD